MKHSIVSLLSLSVLMACSDEKPAPPTSAGEAALKQAVREEIEASPARLSERKYALGEVSFYGLTDDKIAQTEKMLATISAADAEEFKKRAVYSLSFRKQRTQPFDVVNDSPSFLRVNYNISAAGLMNYLRTIPVKGEKAVTEVQRAARQLQQEIKEAAALSKLPAWITNVDTMVVPESAEERACLVRGLKTLSSVDLVNLPEKAFSNIVIRTHSDSHSYLTENESDLIVSVWIDCRHSAEDMSKFLHSLPNFEPIAE